MIEPVVNDSEMCLILPLDSLPSVVTSVPGSVLLDISMSVPEVSLRHATLNKRHRENHIFKANGLDPVEMAGRVRRARIIDRPKINDRQVILSERLTKLNARAVGWPTRYVVVREIDRRNDLEGKVIHRPNVLTSNAFMVDSKQRRICVHRRSAANETFGEFLHVWGGAYDPMKDRADGLQRTASREIYEESKKRYRVTLDGCVAILQHETTTNYTMVTFLGVPLESPPGGIDNRGQWEGFAMWFSFDQIPSVLGNSLYNWVPPGKQAVLVWMALGMPMRDRKRAIPKSEAELLYLKTLAAMEG